MYKPGASLVVKPGVVVTGTMALREALAGFVALKPTLTSEAQQVVEAGDVALCCARWSLRGTDPTGNPMEIGSLYCTAVIVDDRLYLKSDPTTRGEFEAKGLSPFTYIARGKSMSITHGMKTC